VLKVDVYWFKGNKGSPALDFFPRFWEILTPFDCRFHWGKHMPVNPDYLSKQFRCWERFMELRDALDPDQLFVSRYWRDRLGIEVVSYGEAGTGGVVTAS
jgi:D-arabinono-1,4-lactone oxidase